MHYNKLVRDRIPQIIAGTGRNYSIKFLDQSEYVKELRKKCFEELQEYANAIYNEVALEELAGLLEIVHALADFHGTSIENLEKLRK
ncbi:nucleoside triphosphate pyrophosphohydrolase [Cytobacillus sp. NJ13]|nr:nucleoside triphosphate pyrophosphohydrolase [Cytobacillus sp. NJ13]